VYIGEDGRADLSVLEPGCFTPSSASETSW
jgi:hypothetical protein